eukprot:Skav224820  [mRNA]  locus=scaffold613:19394:24168:+ [translate_table: standard]
MSSCRSVCKALAGTGYGECFCGALLLTDMLPGLSGPNTKSLVVSELPQEGEMEGVMLMKIAKASLKLLTQAVLLILNGKKGVQWRMAHVKWCGELEADEPSQESKPRRRRKKKPDAQADGEVEEGFSKEEAEVAEKPTKPKKTSSDAGSRQSKRDAAEREVISEEAEVADEPAKTKKTSSDAGSRQSKRDAAEREVISEEAEVADEPAKTKKTSSDAGSRQSKRDAAEREVISEEVEVAEQPAKTKKTSSDAGSRQSKRDVEEAEVAEQPSTAEKKSSIANEQKPRSSAHQARDSVDRQTEAITQQREKSPRGSGVSLANEQKPRSSAHQARDSVDRQTEAITQQREKSPRGSGVSLANEQKPRSSAHQARDSVDRQTEAITQQREKSPRGSGVSLASEQKPRSSAHQASDSVDRQTEAITQQQEKSPRGSQVSGGRPETTPVVAAEEPADIDKENWTRRVTSCNRSNQKNCLSQTSRLCKVQKVHVSLEPPPCYSIPSARMSLQTEVEEPEEPEEEAEIFDCEAGDDVKELGLMPTAFAPDPVEIASVTDGSWADTMGIQPGDSLIKINGAPVEVMDKKEMKRAMRERPLTLTVSRPVFATPEASLDDMETFECIAPEGIQDLGLYPSAFPPEAMTIQSVTDGSWASQQGIRVGDELVEIGQQPVQEMAAKEAKRAMRSRPLHLVFQRLLQNTPSGAASASSGRSGAGCEDVGKGASQAGSQQEAGVPEADGWDDDDWNKPAKSSEKSSKDPKDKGGKERRDAKDVKDKKADGKDKKDSKLKSSDKTKEKDKERDRSKSKEKDKPKEKAKESKETKDSKHKTEKAKEDPQLGP